MKASAAVVALSVFCAFSSAFAGRTLKFNGATDADYGVTNRTAASGAPYWDGDNGDDRHCSNPGLVFVTNNVGWTWQFEFGSAAGTTLRICAPDGYMSSDLRPGNSANTLGVVDIQEGAKFQGSFIAGFSGYGVVTNSGYWDKNGPLQLGIGKTGHGVFVFNGTIYNRNPKEMHIGEKGWGELFINKPMWWSFNKHTDGDIIVGQSQHTNRIVISETGQLTAYYLYLGGYLSGQAGHGELQLRGGVYCNDKDNGPKEDLFYLGACPNAATNGVDDASFGAIRGWGQIIGGNVSRVRERGVYIRMGHGEIVGDGEGDESRILDFGDCVYQVTNALPATQLSTSGWRAVNKGMVMLSRANYFGWEVGETNVCVGCALCLEKPDLVNAAKIYARWLPRNVNKSFGAAVLAADRSDAHTNALPKRVVNVLGVHRLGGFGNMTTQIKLAFPSYKADIRYDQTKLRHDDSRLELLRYSEATGRWTSLVKLAPGERPADCVLAMPDYITDQDAKDTTYTLGTYAVAETKPTGFVLSLR